MAMEAEIETAQSVDCGGHATGAADAANIPLLKYSDDVGNGYQDPGHNRVGKGSSTNHNVIDILDLAVPRPKVRPIDRLLDRYDWSSTAMMPLLQRDTDRPLLSRPGGPAPPTRTRSTRKVSKSRLTTPTKSRAPPPPPATKSRAPPPPPPTRPPSYLDLADRRRPVRKSLWKRARELVSNCFVRETAARPRTVGFWSR